MACRAGYYYAQGTSLAALEAECLLKSCVWHRRALASLLVPKNPLKVAPRRAVQFLLLTLGVTVTLTDSRLEGHLQ
ncbi:hypothetical protein XENTR_v10004336 [Xenopus tropicalis]|nr:hypothetical protein XENTR_v10004336 [Xenopus tropicalis]